MNITVKFGPANSTSFDAPAGATVGSVLSNPNLKAILKFGDNVRGVVDGVVQTSSSPLSEGDVLHIETKANEKGSL